MYIDDRQRDMRKKAQSSALLMLLVVVGMFGFGFAMVPLYDLLCSVTGLNGSTTGRIEEKSLLSSKADLSRTIVVQFDATNNAGLPWEFHPLVKKIEVHPGEVKEVVYFAKNNSNKTIIAQAIPGITPWQATSHFNKTECFCFTQQKLEPGESREMPLRFIISPDIPQEITTLTLSYTFMDTDRTKLKEIDEAPQINSALTSKNKSFTL